ncbi:secondary thiamine-phosphate synthase enzyme YjbQ [candidate division KSB1 bacterium]|nr:secondary thiamine-phosphate synthase enzyme YjbQ [candidate division KSB1 bacterium]
MAFLREVSIRTNAQVQFINVDHQVRQVIQESGIQQGFCYLFVPHTTAGLTINENADPDVVRDIIQQLNQLVPFSNQYRHAEGNSAAHIKSSLVGVSQTIMLENGRLSLGAWQSIFFCEFDGPRHRKLMVKVY